MSTKYEGGDPTQVAKWHNHENTSIQKSSPCGNYDMPHQVEYSEKGRLIAIGPHSFFKWAENSERGYPWLEYCSQNLLPMIERCSFSQPCSREGSISDQCRRVSLSKVNNSAHATRIHAQTQYYTRNSSIYSKSMCSINWLRCNKFDHCRSLMAQPLSGIISWTL